MIVIITGLIGVLGLLCLLRLWLILGPFNKKARSSSPLSSEPSTKTFRTMIVLGSGGHTAEMLRLLSSLNLHKYQPRVYWIATSDSHSEGKLAKWEGEGRYQALRVPRSREVGQSWLSSVWTTARSFAACLLAVLRWRPQLLLLNGPGTCVPIAYAVVLLNFVRFWQPKCKIVYVESVCRVTSLSLSARLLFPFLDRLLVQWPSLASRKAEYHGRLV